MVELVGSVPAGRVTSCNERPVRTDGSFVLYWMNAFRRVRSNFALQRAVDWARELNKPLAVLDVLRCSHRWASDRVHRFVLDGMADVGAALARAGVCYQAYIEPERGRADPLLDAAMKHACVAVTDDFPSFVLPEWVERTAARAPVRVEKIDSNGLLPLRAAPRVFPTAYAFRRFLQKNLTPHFDAFPKAEPLRGMKLPALERLPAEITRAWPGAGKRLLAGDSGSLAELPIDHGVAAAPVRGGPKAAGAALRRFVDKALDAYATERNHPDAEATSGLSPYLHFGHISAHEVFTAVASHEDWSVESLGDKTQGQRQGWWGVGESAEGFLDQLVTWRELGYNMSWQRPGYERYDSLPRWARETLADHAGDAREHVYTLEQFEAADTHDPLWNAAQRQLTGEGQLHNYLRMLWGKKILEWSASPEDALATMVELNNKYALDGRNPNSTSGIFWVLGRYDRAWGPERPVFGKIRYMSSENTARKVRLKEYLQRYGA